MKRQVPLAALFFPFLLVKGHLGSEISPLGIDLKTFASGERSKLPYAKLSDQVPMKKRRSRFVHLFRRTDIEILLQTSPVHSCAIVFHLNHLIGHPDFDLCGVGIIGIVDHLPDELNAL